MKTTMNNYQIKEQLKRLQASKIKSPAVKRAIVQLEQLLKGGNNE